jgi:hypothetical protein
MTWKDIHGHFPGATEIHATTTNAGVNQVHWILCESPMIAANQADSETMW